jgi:hypothetical protein
MEYIVVSVRSVRGAFGHGAFLMRTTGRVLAGGGMKIAKCWLGIG